MNSIDVKYFGAIGDGKIDETAIIQKAIDICVSENKELIISEGIYNIGTIFIKNNSNIKLEKNAVLNGITEIEKYSSASTFVDAVGKVRGKALFVICDAKNIKIYGEGKICGNGAELKSEERPFLFRIDNSENISVSGIRLESSPSWCLHIDKSKNIYIDSIAIFNRGCANNDGIDIDSSENIKIINCDISSGDDGICVKTTSNKPCKNITVKNCRVSTDWGAFKIGTESVGDISDIEVSDCEFYDVLGGGIKIVPVDGSNVRNVVIKNVTMKNCTGPIFIANGERNREYAGEKRDTLSTVKNVEISTITGDIVKAPERGIWDNEVWGNAIGGIILSGTENNPLEDIRINNVKLSMPGGYMGEIPTYVREMEKMYPEFHRFDPIPSKGVYIRHAKDVNVENIDLNFKENDIRETVYFEDVENVSFNEEK